MDVHPYLLDSSEASSIRGHTHSDGIGIKGSCWVLVYAQSNGLGERP
jgi:hypothetical protein